MKRIILPVLLFCAAAGGLLLSQTTGKKPPVAQIAPPVTTPPNSARPRRPELATFPGTLAEFNAAMNDYEDKLEDWLKGEPPFSSIGRYQLVINPTVRADTFLVDTKTGRIWSRTKITDIVGEPEVWMAEPRMDNEQEFTAWGASQKFKDKASK
jgi:hypothetical protein